MCETDIGAWYLQGYIVGDEIRRGVLGGQKKCVTID